MSEHEVNEAWIRLSDALMAYLIARGLEVDEADSDSTLRESIEDMILAECDDAEAKE